MNWLAEKIEQWPTAKLLPYARNARTHSEDQVAQIAASIAEFGFTNPILAGSDGSIVAGHGRLAAAQKLGLERVPVVVLDHLTPTQRRALVIADNRIAENAGWDDSMLRIELEALQLEGFDLDITGFDADALAELIAGDEPDNEGQTDEDAVPEVGETPISRPGLGRSAYRRPSTVTAPDVAGVRPTRIRIVVDLPAPLGPRKPVTRPGSARKVTWSTAVKPPYFLVSESTMIMTRTLARAGPCPHRGAC